MSLWRSTTTLSVPPPRHTFLTPPHNSTPPQTRPSTGCLLLRPGPGEAWVDCRSVGSSGRPIPGEVGAVDATAFRCVRSDAVLCTTAPWQVVHDQHVAWRMQQGPSGQAYCAWLVLKATLHCVMLRQLTHLSPAATTFHPHCHSPLIPARRPTTNSKHMPTTPNTQTGLLVRAASWWLKRTLCFRAWWTAACTNSCPASSSQVRLCF